MNRRIVPIFAAAALTLAGLLGTALAQGDSWGDVKGRIVWGGANVPAQAPIDLKENPDKAVCGKVMDESYVVNPKDKGLKNVFVWIDVAKKGEKLPIHPSLKTIKETKVVVDQPSCAFIAHAVALRGGQTLVAKNSAAIAHNFKWTGNPTVNPGGNVLLPPGASKEIDDLKADRLPIAMECNIHPWMKGWVRVFDHPYFAVTDADGNFTIKNAPAGDYRLKVWQGTGGWLGGTKGKDGTPITIRPGENKVEDMIYAPPGG